MEKLADEMEEDIRTVLNRLPENDDSIEEIDSLMLVSLLEPIAENAKFYKIILGSRRTPIFTERLLKMLSEMIALRVDKTGSDSLHTRSGVPKDIAIWYGSSALIGTIVAWIKNDMPYTLLFLAKHFTMMSRK
ncbi:TetR-like C-terminal domain-containing protein [Paenibacillus harenae]|uniref:TetR-like C-terminal domain-containing protein n=1 Tax=Paenibacillus harenae TaxID=306543 RepID=UPI00278CAF5B|nr:TetR-like C-terminal domain-containing protein [Paenibacillus harenae]MDQ0063837.1 hypothetical protein [Paenibacillus harenae]